MVVLSCFTPYPVVAARTPPSLGCEGRRVRTVNVSGGVAAPASPLNVGRFPRRVGTAMTGRAAGSGFRVRRALSNPVAALVGAAPATYRKRTTPFGRRGRGASRGVAVAPTRAVPPEVVQDLVGLADPFGVSAERWEFIEGNLFSASLFPYLVFLYYLGMPESNMPRKALFGFQFLLVFVFGTIPCAIYAKLQFEDILANVDWLHGAAESLLTVTNILIVIGMREGLRTLKKANAGDAGGDGSSPRTRSSASAGGLLRWSAAASVTTIAVVGGAAALSGGTEAADTTATAAASLGEAASLFLFRHAEPDNALSLPTWVIHISSLIEWLVAMELIWEYAEVSGNKQYKALTWAMVPCHASGIAACTFHLFYNSPLLSALVATQAGLTVLGNTACALAAYRIAKEGGAMVTLPWEEGFVLPWKSTSDESEKGAKAGALSSGAVGAGTAAGEGISAAAAGGVKLASGGGDDVSDGGATDSGLVGLEIFRSAWATGWNTDAAFVLKLTMASAALSAAVKWGSLEADFPFQPSVWVAFTLIFGPTILTCIKLSQVSKAEDEAAAAR